MAEYYFAYGSNMNPLRVQKRQMGFKQVLAGTLKDYRLAFNKRSVKFPGSASANVMQHVGAETEGVLYRLSELNQIEQMDPFEGYPIRYDRKALSVKTSRGDVNAWVYIANADYIADAIEGLKPNRWYLNHLLAGSDYLSDSYLEALRHIECLPDSEVEPV